MGNSCWKLPESQLVSLTPGRARDLVVECFFFAQRETFTRARQKLGATHIDDTSLRANVVGAVRLAFKESGGDYDHPTVASLANAIAVLGRKAESWGTPQDIIQHHANQIGAMLQRMGHDA
jgi:hypothetical protein